jgi:hypothetical protein
MEAFMMMAVVFVGICEIFPDYTSGRCLHARSEEEEARAIECVFVETSRRAVGLNVELVD